MVDSDYIYLFICVSQQHPTVLAFKLLRQVQKHAHHTGTYLNDVSKNDALKKHAVKNDAVKKIEQG